MTEIHWGFKIYSINAFVLVSNGVPAPLYNNSVPKMTTPTISSAVSAATNSATNGYCDAASLPLALGTAAGSAVAAVAPAVVGHCTPTKTLTPAGPPPPSRHNGSTPRDPVLSDEGSTYSNDIIYQC